MSERLNIIPRNWPSSYWRNSRQGLQKKFSALGYQSPEVMASAARVYTARNARDRFSWKKYLMPLAGGFAGWEFYAKVIADYSNIGVAFLFGLAGLAAGIALPKVYYEKVQSKNEDRMAEYFTDRAAQIYSVKGQEGAKTDYEKMKIALEELQNVPDWGREIREYVGRAVEIRLIKTPEILAFWKNFDAKPAPLASLPAIEAQAPVPAGPRVIAQSEIENMLKSPNLQEKELGLLHITDEHSLPYGRFLETLASQINRAVVVPYEEGRECTPSQVLYPSKFALTSIDEIYRSITDKKQRDAVAAIVLQLKSDIDIIYKWDQKTGLNDDRIRLLRQTILALDMLAQKDPFIRGAKITYTEADKGLLPLLEKMEKTSQGPFKEMVDHAILKLRYVIAEQPESQAAAPADQGAGNAATVTKKVGGGKSEGK